MNLNLKREEKEFLYIKHRKEGDNEINSKTKVKLVDREVRSIKEMERFDSAKRKAFILTIKRSLK